jgi:uncharacterized protein (DUF58 family)
MASTSTQHQPATLLDPRALAKLSKLELVSRHFMDGFVQGLHRSPHLGFALDFAQHRQYAPGDDIKRLDWRVFAKADRFYIKQYEVSTTLRAHIVLDASGSMAYRGQHDAMSKFRYAQFVAACLAYLILHQQDAAGLVTFDNKVREVLPPRTAPSHLLRLVGAIDGTVAERESAIAPILHDVAERLTHRGMVIVISDFVDRAGDIVEALHHLRHKRHEVMLLQMMADDELTFPFRKWSLFENLERGDQRLRLDPSLVRARYMANLAEHMQTLGEGVRKLAIQHVLMNTNKPFDEALVAYLARRMGKK